MKDIPVNLARARYHIEQHFPYFAPALYALQWVERPGLRAIVADTRWRIYTSTEYLNETPIDEIAGGILLEISRLLRNHGERPPRFDSEEEATLWALASMLEVSDDFASLEGVSLPFGSPKPADFDMKDGSLVEEYFSGLLEGMVKIDFKIIWGSAADGQPHPWELGDDEQTPGLDGIQGDLLRDQIAKGMTDFHAQGRGTVPAGFRRWANDQLNPKVDWRRHLRRVVGMSYQNAYTKIDYTYTKPNRRAGGFRPFMLPSLVGRSPHVAMVIDTSGSMSEEDLAQALGEVGGVLSAVGSGNPISVLSADAAAHTCQKVMSRSRVELKGGGGTDMAVGIEAAAKLKPRPQVIIVFTDGDTPWPASPPKGIQVIIVICRMRQNQLPMMARQIMGIMEPPSWATVVRIN